MISRTTAVRLVGVAYLAAVAIWFTFEELAAEKYYPRYSYTANMISDLGVPYVWHDEDLHRNNEYSSLSWLMNVNFFLTACLYAFPQWLLLTVTHGEAHNDKYLRLARAVLSAMFLIGLILVGIFHGGPKEHADGSIIEHQLGATFAILGGNLCSIFAGVSPSQITPVATGQTYRVGSILLGVLGLAAVIALVTITPEDHAGLVERVSVYTIFAWQVLTGSFLLAAPKHAASKVKTG